MIVGLDHVVILVRDIEAAVMAYRTVLGRAPSWRSAGDGAASVFFTLDNMSVELLAPGGEGPGSERIAAALAAQGEGLASLCFRVTDIAAMQRRLERVGLRPELVADGSSRDVLSGATLSWQRTRAATEASHGIRLFFLAMAGTRPQSEAVVPTAVERLDHVVIETADPERAAALYGARLGLDLRLDRSHPDWGRLMFFRCSDVIVETVQRAGKDYSSGQDRLWGLCWRVADITASRARMIAAGLDVSEPRPGRKPGTQVATIRGGTCGVPTLLIQAKAQTPAT